jgi:hypothetical protein
MPQHCSGQLTFSIQPAYLCSPAEQEPRLFCSALFLAQGCLLGWLAFNAELLCWQTNGVEALAEVKPMYGWPFAASWHPN